MGDGEITESFRKKLMDDLDHLQLAFVKMSELYHACLNNYADVLQKTIANSESYLSQNDLIKLQQAQRKAAQLKVHFFTKHICFYDVITHCSFVRHYVVFRRSTTFRQ